MPPKGWARAAASTSHALPCLLAQPCLTRMTGLALPTSLRKGRGLDLLGPSCPDIKSLIPWTTSTTWSLVPYFPHPHQEERQIRSPVTNSHPPLCLFQYISKNVPATDHVIRRETETTFSGSHSCSPSHHCSTATPTSSHRWAPPRLTQTCRFLCAHPQRACVHAHTPAWGHTETPQPGWALY